jgi:hypothetical protein
VNIGQFLVKAGSWATTSMYLVSVNLLWSSYSLLLSVMYISFCFKKLHPFCYCHVPSSSVFQSTFELPEWQGQPYTHP